MFDEYFVVLSSEVHLFSFTSWAEFHCQSFVELCSVCRRIDTVLVLSGGQLRVCFEGLFLLAAKCEGQDVSGREADASPQPAAGLPTPQ